MIQSWNSPHVQPLHGLSVSALKPEHQNSTVFLLRLLIVIFKKNVLPLRKGDVGLFTTASARVLKHLWNFAEKGTRGFFFIDSAYVEIPNSHWHSQMSSSKQSFGWSDIQQQQGVWGKAGQKRTFLCYIWTILQKMSTYENEPFNLILWK